MGSDGFLDSPLTPSHPIPEEGRCVKNKVKTENKRKIRHDTIIFTEPTLGGRLCTGSLAVGSSLFSPGFLRPRLHPKAPHENTRELSIRSQQHTDGAGAGLWNKPPRPPPLAPHTVRSSNIKKKKQAQRANGPLTGQVKTQSQHGNTMRTRIFHLRSLCCIGLLWHDPRMAQKGLCPSAGGRPRNTIRDGV